MVYLFARTPLSWRSALYVGPKFSILRPIVYPEPKFSIFGVQLSILASSCLSGHIFSRDILLQKLGGWQIRRSRPWLQNTLGLRILMVEEILDEPRERSGESSLG